MKYSFSIKLDDKFWIGLLAFLFSLSILGILANANTFITNTYVASSGCVGGGGTTGTAGPSGNTWRLCQAGTQAANSWLYLYNGAGTAYHDLAVGNLYAASAITQGSTQVLNTVSAGTGLSGGGSGPSTSLSVSYGSSAGTAVQGNTQITVSPGTDMSGGGTLTLGSGGTVTLSDASTLATVTGRGASTSTELTLSGGIATPVSFPGSVGTFSVESSGGAIDFSRASYNYIKASSAGGILELVANGDGYGTLNVYSGKVGITNNPAAQFTPGNTLDVNGGITLGSGAVQSTHALCWASTGAIGYCTTVISSTGTCTCTAIT